MDIYSQKSRWKLYLGIAGLVIVLISMVYTSFLAERLKVGERNKAALLVQAIQSLSQGDLEQDITFQLNIIESNNDIPVIAVNTAGKIDFAKNFGEQKDFDIPFLEKELETIKQSGPDPISIAGFHNIYYKESNLFKLLTYFPLLQMLLLSAFILTGYISFSSARRAEQNRVWAGMAKETAHQLGTPISAIIAWIEHLKLLAEGNEEIQEVVGELNNDVKRLDLVADRFSKIGSTPTLKPVNVYEELEKCRVYMQRRASRKMVFDFPKETTDLEININPHLFDWVIENLIRNALDAMDGKGKISANVFAEKGFVVIDISDTGKGIASNRFKTIFEPGFTTKTRGWGLGLSLAKRIVESYHSGKIFVKKSIVNEGTTFTIKLPKV